MTVVKQGFIFLCLLSFVLLVNFSIISFDMMYPEQPLLYLANQRIHSLSDLLNIYLHPRMFHLSLLFFRPSGHFLMYQLLQPLLGWHNTRGLLIVNFSFLALTGFFMIRLYELLFPGFKLGGYLAFSLYLMHPALMLSRLISLHFEFAYVCFLVLSLYCFVRFCQNKKVLKFLAGTVLFYALAISFKEPALMLGPLLMFYFCLSNDEGQPLLKYLAALFSKKEAREVLLLLAVTSFSLGLYLSLQWPTLIHPFHQEVHPSLILDAFLKLLGLMAGFGGKGFSHPSWRNVIFPAPATFFIDSFLVLMGVATVCLFQAKDQAVYKKGLLFLYLASAAFLLLPVFWSWGLPWHLNVSLVFLSLMMGFSGEYLCKLKLKSEVILGGLALLIGFTTLSVNQRNIDYLIKEQGFALAVGRNAVFHPPLLGAKLKADTVIVVEDSLLQDSYLLGASIYPFATITMNNPNLDQNKEQFKKLAASFYIKQELVYNGTLFRWAYLMPNLKEEVVPFRVEELAKVPDLIFYDWLEHFDKLVCLGYDREAHWHDRTELFKKNLLVERERRKLSI